MKEIIIVLFTMLNISAFAWGSKGHKIIAEIAKRSLDKSVIDSVQFYLGTMSFAEASVWMDEVRSNDSYDYMKPMHYVNVEQDKTYVKIEGVNIANQISLANTQLKEKTGGKKGINENLKFIFHLVGDIHQPLHCGYSKDKGGNTIEVLFLSKETNLHKVWDTDLIEASGITLNSCLNFCNNLSQDEKKKLFVYDIDSWVNESRLLLPAVYDFKDGVINQDYISKNKPVVERQLVSAGVRLAFMLNSYFKNN